VTDEIKYQRVESALGEVANRRFLVVSKLGNCSVCGELTNLIDICLEAHVCSEDCAKVWDERCAESEEKAELCPICDTKLSAGQCNRCGYDEQKTECECCGEPVDVGAECCTLCYGLL